MTFKDLAKLLIEYPANKILFVGLGNEYRGDDGAGLVILNRIIRTSKFSKSVHINAGRNPENYLHDMLNCKVNVIVFIDSAFTGKNPGQISLLESSEIDKLKISTHSYSIKLIEEYLSAHCKIKFIYLIIEPETTGFIKQISDSVNRGIELFFKE